MRRLPLCDALSFLLHFYLLQLLVFSCIMTSCTDSLTNNYRPRSCAFTSLALRLSAFKKVSTEAAKDSFLYIPEQQNRSNVVFCCPSQFRTLFSFTSFCPFSLDNFFSTPFSCSNCALSVPSFSLFSFLILFLPFSLQSSHPRLFISSDLFPRVSGETWTWCLLVNRGLAGIKDGKCVKTSEVTHCRLETRKHKELYRYITLVQKPKQPATCKLVLGPHVHTGCNMDAPLQFCQYSS